MKFFTAATVLAIFVMGAIGAPLAAPEAEAKSSCYRYGEPCFKAKREAIAEALAEAKSSCHRFGEPCMKLKRAVEVYSEIFGEDSDHSTETKTEALYIREAVAEAKSD